MSGGAERYIDVNVETAIGRLRDTLPDMPIARSRVFEVFFPAASTPRDVQHEMGVIPTGFIVLLSVGSRIDGVNLTLWTPEIAFLQSNAANVRARLYFILTEVPTNA